MSIWTHVVGVIRFDGLSFAGTPEPDCGFTCDFEDNEDTWDRCNIPCGSEGSLQISKWINPEGSALARYTYSIFGDLRDYDDEKEIIDYFNRIVKDQMIRQACFTFQVEGGDSHIFYYDNNLKVFVEIFELKLQN